MSANSNVRRALHWVFKIGNRKDSTRFFREILGMKVLRHEEFDKGCEAACNGPYNMLWSKTMIGYGGEDTHFVAELTYNYGIGSYKYAQDFLGMTIHSKTAVANVKRENLKFETVPNSAGFEQILVHSPDGYPFYLNDVDVEASADPVQKVSIASSNLQRSLDYWHGILGLTIFDKQSTTALLGYGQDQAKLEIIDVGKSIDHGTAHGRIAFSCPTSQLLEIQSQIDHAKGTILTRHITLSTPGKADVQVVILADPDGYEICFGGREGFLELSKFDPHADQSLNECIINDKSEQWFRDGKPSG